MKLSLILAFFLVSWGGTGFQAAALEPLSPVRVGYLPTYEPLPSEAQVALLTHLVYFSLVPSAHTGLEGRPFNTQRAAALRAMTKKLGVKFLVSIGGYDQSKGFADQTKDSDARENFARQMADFAQTHDFDGVDLDWEFPATTAERVNYAAFIKVLGRKLHPDRLLTVNMHRVTNYMQGADPSDLDWVQVMGYDQSKGVKTDPTNPLDQGSYTSLGHNGDYAESLDQLAFWVKEGFPPSKIVLGVPFYGETLKDGTTPAMTQTYKQIVASGSVEPDADLYHGFYFNGPATIAKKCDYLKAGGFRGIMVWEIGQDADGDQALLRVIGDRLR